jgi:hypothetical protein
VVNTLEHASAAIPTVGVKGSMVRSLVMTLTQHGRAEAVAAKVSPDVRALIEEPPVSTEWVDARLHNQIYVAIVELYGEDRLRALNREAAERGVSLILRGTVEGILRMFGVSPPTLLSRLDRVAGTTSRGVLYRYTGTGANQGQFEIEYPSLTQVPMAPFVATAGALEIVFDFCGVKGSIDQPMVVDNGRHNRVRFAVAWNR